MKNFILGFSALLVSLLSGCQSLAPLPAVASIETKKIEVSKPQQKTQVRDSRYVIDNTLGPEMDPEELHLRVASVGPDGTLFVESFDNPQPASNPEGLLLVPGDFVKAEVIRWATKTARWPGKKIVDYSFGGRIVVKQKLPAGEDPILTRIPPGEY